MQFESIIHIQDVDKVLTAATVPTDLDKLALYQEQEKYIFAILLLYIHTDKGCDILLEEAHKPTLSAHAT